MPAHKVETSVYYLYILKFPGNSLFPDIGNILTACAQNVFTQRKLPD